MSDHGKAWSTAESAISVGNIELLDEALRSAETALAVGPGPNASDLAKLKLLRAKQLSLLGQPQHAYPLATDAVRELRVLPEADHRQRALTQALIECSDAACGVGDLYLGRSLAAEAVATAQVSLGAHDPDTISAWISLGECSRYLGNLNAAAAPSARRARDAARHPEDAPSDFVRLDSSVAALERLAGNLTSAEALVRHALRLRHPRDICRARDLTLQAGVLADTGRTAESEIASAEAHITLARAGKTDSLDRACLIAVDVLIAHRRGSVDDSLRLYTEAIATIDDLLGTVHPDVGVILVDVARLEFGAR